MASKRRGDAFYMIWRTYQTSHHLALGHATMHSSFYKLELTLLDRQGQELMLEIPARHPLEIQTPRIIRGTEIS
jgi:hypothetical protein